MLLINTVGLSSVHEELWGALWSCGLFSFHIHAGDRWVGEIKILWTDCSCQWCLHRLMSDLTPDRIIVKYHETVNDMSGIYVRYHYCEGSLRSSLKRLDSVWV